MKEKEEERQRDTLPITELLRMMLGNGPLAYGIEKQQVKEAWFRLIGAWGAKYTQSVELRGDVLYVHLSSAVIKDELSYDKTDIIAKINKELGKDVITQLVLL